ncbi:MAG: NrtA/SsuA/CpmA family ABC transporter substrate-binding protein [Stappiaceae bacterium]
MLHWKRTALTVGLSLAFTATSAMAVWAEPIRMSSRSSNWDIVLIESGIAEKYGLELEVVPMKTGVEVTEALIGGSVDVGSVGETPLTSLLSKTDLVSVIGTAVSTDGGYAQVIVPKDSPIQTIEDLKGKRIATKVGSGSYRALNDWCAKNGCSLSDFEILNTSPGAILAAIEAGSVDAGIWFAPTTSIAVAKGFGRIMMNFSGANEGQASWVSNRAFAEENPELVAKFIAATIEAQRIFSEDPDRAAALLETGMQKRGRDLTADILKMGLADFDYTPSFDPERKVRVFEGVFESLSAAGKLSGDMPDFKAALVPDVHAKALEMVGTGN